MNLFGWLRKKRFEEKSVATFLVTIRFVDRNCAPIIWRCGDIDAICKRLPTPGESYLGEIAWEWTVTQEE